MMHAFCFVGGSAEKRARAAQEKLIQWRVSPFDQITVSSETTQIGIDEVRNLIHRLVLRPYNSPFSVGIIPNAQSLTIQAQHALLKTLEEPPSGVRLILETPNAAALLPTIVSRCQVVDLGALFEFTKDELFQCFKTLEQLLKAPIGEKLKIIDSIATSREDALAWTELAIAAGRELLLQGKISTALIRGLLVARSQLLANVNPKLVLDNLFLSV